MAGLAPWRARLDSDRPHEADRLTFAGSVRVLLVNAASNEAVKLSRRLDLKYPRLDE